jgi:hypothetical protein
MLKRKVRLLTTVSVLSLAVSMLGMMSAPAGAATTPRTQASPDVITDTALQNAYSGLYVQTHGHQNIVTVSSSGRSYLSQINCKEYSFPYGTHPACELENESGLCLDASAPYYPYITAESCVSGDTQEEWWASTYASPDYYWMINAYWSSYFDVDIYMTEGGSASGSDIGVLGAGYGLAAVWAY